MYTINMFDKILQNATIFDKTIKKLSNKVKQEA